MPVHMHVSGRHSPKPSVWISADGTNRGFQIFFWVHVGLENEIHELYCRIYFMV